MRTVNARKSADALVTKKDDGPLHHEQKQKTTKKRASDMDINQSKGAKRLKKKGSTEGKKSVTVSEPKKRIQQLNYRANMGTILKLLRKLKLTDKHKAEIRKNSFLADC